MSLPVLVSTALLGLFLLVYLGHRALRDRSALRRLPAAEDLPEFPARGAELGQSLHLSLGTGEVGEGPGGLATLASLSLVEGLAGRAWRSGAPFLISAASGSALALAFSLAARLRRGAGGAEEGATVRVLGLGRAPYAAAGLGRVARQPSSLELYAGDFGEEYLLLAEAAARHGRPVFAGAGRPEVLPDLLLTARSPLLGEELYAAGAYAGGRDGRARLAAQDWLRWALVGLSVVLALLGLWGAAG